MRATIAQSRSCYQTPPARIANWTEVERECREVERKVYEIDPKTFERVRRPGGGYTGLKEWAASDPARWAAANGIDAYTVRRPNGESFLVVVNRRKLIVDERTARGAAVGSEQDSIVAKLFDEE